MAVSGIAACALSIVIFGLEPWREWAAAIPAFQKVLIEGGVLRYLVSPAGVAQYWGYPGWPFHLGGIALGLAAIARSARKVEGIELAALIATASLLASPYALATDLIPVLPFLACAVWRAPLSMVAVAAFLILSMLHVAAGLMLLAISWSFRFGHLPEGRPVAA